MSEPLRCRTMKKLYFTATYLDSDRKYDPDLNLGHCLKVVLKLDENISEKLWMKLGKNFEKHDEKL